MRNEQGAAALNTSPGMANKQQTGCPKRKYVCQYERSLVRLANQQLAANNMNT